MWRAHQQPNGLWYVQSHLYHAVTAVNLSEGKAQEMAMLLNEAAGLALPRPAPEQAEWWHDEWTRRTA